MSDLYSKLLSILGLEREPEGEECVVCGDMTTDPFLKDPVRCSFECSDTYSFRAGMANFARCS